MSAKNEIFNKLIVLNKLKEEFLNEIKLLYVLNDNVFIVTNDDKVFAFGNNNYGVLGFGNKREIKELTINEDLSNKKINYFNNNVYHAIARTYDNKIYCWGCNDFGALVNSQNKPAISLYNKPELIEFFNDKQIIDICCGLWHTIVLTNDGEVYAWGKNDCGQIANGGGYNNKFRSLRDHWRFNIETTPIKIDGFNNEKVVMISCGIKHSMALTESGHVFSWGWNSYGQLGHNYPKDSYKPSSVRLSDKILIKKISCGELYSLLLTRDGDIYAFGDNRNGQLGIYTADKKQIIPTKLEISNKFIEIASHCAYNISIALSVNNIYYVWGNCGENNVVDPEETEFKSLNDIFNHYFGVTYNTMDIDIELQSQNWKQHFKQSIDSHQSKGNKTGEVLEIDISSIKTLDKIKTRYESDFKELGLIGDGGFGKVFKVINSLDLQQYAIKIINLKGNSPNLSFMF